jgi:outer membrane protein
VIAAAIASIALSFSGLTLEQAESDGVVASPDVNIAAAKLDEANRQFGAVQSGLGPTLISGYTRTPQGNPPDETITQQLYTAGIGLNLEDFLAQATRVRDASKGLAGARSDLLATAREERVKVLGLYYDALKARSIEAARKSTLEIAGEIRDTAARRVAAGKSRRIELVRANVAVSEAQAAETDAQAAYDNAIDALRTETGGIASEAFSNTLPGEIPPIDPLLLDPLHASVTALKHRSEVASAEAALDSAKAEAKLARYDAAPAVTLGAGFTGGIDAGVAIGGPSATVLVSYPLSGKAANTIGIQDAKVTEAAARLAGTERTIVLAITQASRSLAAARDTADSNGKAREQAEEELHSARRGYDRGTATSLELITARETYTRALVNEIASQYDLIKAQQSLELEIGV